MKARHRPQLAGVSRGAERALYTSGPSFADHAPWVELDEYGRVLLADSRSVGAVLRVQPAGIDGRSEAAITEQRDALLNAFLDAIPEHEDAPWVVQTYATRTSDLDASIATFSANQRSDNDAYAKAYRSMLVGHWRGVARQRALFVDEQVTRAPWSGGTLHTHLVLYRRLGAHSGVGLNESIEALDRVLTALVSGLAAAGVGAERLCGSAVHGWLSRWFHTRKTYRATDPDCWPVGPDFVSSLLPAHPRSALAEGTWHIDGRVHRCVGIEGFRQRPAIGALTGEQRRGDALCSVLDLLPVGATVCQTLVLCAQEAIERELAGRHAEAVGDAPEAMRCRETIDTTQAIRAQGQRLYRVSQAVYVSADAGVTLDALTDQIQGALLRCGWRAIARRDDIAALDRYLVHLPMSYHPGHDAAMGWRFASLQWAQHAINAAPLLGRATGTGRMGFTAFNRGGDVVAFDPLAQADRAKNAHALIVGPTGAGKSATLTAMLAHVLAVHRPKLFVLEAGNSFGLLADWWAEHGLSVNRVTLAPSQAPALPTFARAGSIGEGDADDALGELELMATLMVTGGEADELARLQRSDRGLLRQAIVLAGQRCDAPRTDDVRAALVSLSAEPDRPAASCQRLQSLADAMGLFCDGFAGELFNRDADAWPDCDVTLVDLGYLAREGYQAHLAIAVIALLSSIQTQAEAAQHGGRETVVTIDEAHLITTHPLLAPHLVKIVKMWRKLGAWLWLATQNLEDFPGEARRLLNMIEWWLCLVLPRDEIEQLGRFRTLTDAQVQMLASATKADRQYTEGVVLADRVELLFRCVPPSLMLSLAMTERHEKHARQQIMTDDGVSELDAAIEIARQLDRDRGIGT